MPGHGALTYPPPGRIKRFSARREMSQAEAVRRGAEPYLDRFPEEVDPRAGWQLPPARACGGFLAPEEAWTALAHEPDGDEGTHPAAR